MLTSPQYEEKELAAFDSFVKSVIRNAGRNIVCAEEIKNSHTLTDSDMVRHILDTHGIEENSFSKYIITDRNGHSCNLTDKSLYDAIFC